MKYERNCPKCGKSIIYKTYGRHWQAIKRNSPCKKCRFEHMAKLRRGMKFSEEWKENLRKNHVNINGKNNPFYGKKHSKETKEKISKSRAGKGGGDKSYSKTPEFRKWMSENHPLRYDPLIKKKWLRNLRKAMKSLTVKKKMREKRLEQLRNGDSVPSFNKNACRYFDKLNSKNNWAGLHALNGGEKQIAGYSVDYYEPNLNMVIEWDEPHHYKLGILRDKDIIRQKTIINEIKCKFFRIKQDTLEMYEVTNEN